MLSDSDYEWLYVHFCELETDELYSLPKTDLTEDEVSVLMDVLLDRRDEVNSMLEELKTKSLRLKKKNVCVVKLPDELMRKIEQCQS
jgi:hypothetical protein